MVLSSYRRKKKEVQGRSGCGADEVPEHHPLAENLAFYDSVNAGEKTSETVQRAETGGSSEDTLSLGVSKG